MQWVDGRDEAALAHVGVVFRNAQDLQRRQPEPAERRLSTSASLAEEERACRHLSASVENAVLPQMGSMVAQASRLFSQASVAFGGQSTAPYNPSMPASLLTGTSRKKFASESSLWVKALLSARLCAAYPSTNGRLGLTSLLHVQLCLILRAPAIMLTCVTHDVLQESVSTPTMRWQSP